MQRYLNNGYQEDFIEDATGEWVRYVDAQSQSAADGERISALEAALRELTEACEKDFTGPLTEGGECPCEDDEAVSAGIDSESPITFGMIRRARAALGDK